MTKKYIVCAGTKAINNNLAAMEFGDELQKDQSRVLINFAIRTRKLGVGFFWSPSSCGTVVNDAKEPKFFFGVSATSLASDNLLKVEHQSQVDTRLAWTAIRLAPKPFTTGWYNAISLNLPTTRERTAPV